MDVRFSISSNYWTRVANTSNSCILRGAHVQEAHVASPKFTPIFFLSTVLKAYFILIWLISNYGTVPKFDTNHLLHMTYHKKHENFGHSLSNKYLRGCWSPVVELTGSREEAATRASAATRPTSAATVAQLRSVEHRQLRVTPTELPPLLLLLPVLTEAVGAATAGSSVVYVQWSMHIHTLLPLMLVSQRFLLLCGRTLFPSGCSRESPRATWRPPR